MRFHAIAKNITVGFFLVILAIPVYAQQDSTEQEILKYQDTDLEIVSKSRKMILDYIQAAKPDQAMRIKKYLDGKYSGKKVVTLWEREECLLGIITGDYASALKISAYSDTISYEGYLYPQRDLFFDELGKIAAAQKESIYQKLQTDNLRPADSRFLQITFKYLISQACRTYADEKSDINKACDQFIQENPYSPYNNFIKEYLRYVYKLSDYSYGMGLNTGYIGLAGSLSKYVTSSPVFGFSFDMIYKKFSTELYIDLCTPSKTKQQFEKRGTWEKGWSLLNAKAEFVFSYPLLYSQSIQLSPFAGCGDYEVSPAGTSDSKDKMAFDTFTFNSGLTFDYFRRDEDDRKENSAGMATYTIVRFRLGYGKLITNETRFQSHFYYLTVSYFWNLQRIIRDM